MSKVGSEMTKTSCTCVKVDPLRSKLNARGRIQEAVLESVEARVRIQ